MAKKKRTLRFKLTLVSITVLVSMCIVLTAISISSSKTLTYAVETYPSAPEGTVWESTELTDTISDPLMLAEQNFRFVSICSMFVIAITGSAIIYFMVKKELSPLEELTLQISHLDVNTLANQIQISSTGDEIEQVSSAISSLAVRVNDAYLMQKNFSSNAAHELRTPLTVIQNKIEVFRLKKERSYLECEELLDVLYKNTGWLSSLVIELLELTNQEKIDMSQTIDLRELTEEIILELEPLAYQSGVHFSIEGAAKIHGNDSLIQRMVFNLMQNAVKYNVTNGAVCVHIAQGVEGVVFSVADTGMGIPEEMKKQIFEPLFRVDKSRSRELGGFGLGLAIAKVIVERHRGTICAEDNMPQGTIFIVRFPIKGGECL